VNLSSKTKTLFNILLVNYQNYQLYSFGGKSMNYKSKQNWLVDIVGAANKTFKVRPTKN
jgi:hypothetical protein